jgi:ABC-2 type transport system permease protein
MTRAVRAILVKEAREIWRDPLSLVLALVLPVVLLLLFTYGMNLDTRELRIGLLDLDRGRASRDYVAGLTASGDVVVEAEATRADELASWLDRGDVDVALVVPPGFERALVARRPAEVALLVDGSYPPQAQGALARLDAAAALHSARLVHEDARAPMPPGPLVLAEPRVWFNPELKSVNFIVPGLFSLILIALAPLLSTLSIVREREHGSIQQLLVAPVSPAAIVVGKAIPYALLAFAELLLVLVAGLSWFRVPMRGSVSLMLGAGVVYVSCTVGIGLLVSTVTRSQVVALLLAFVATLMPSLLFSGFLFPVYSMTARYQLLSLAFPARYFTEIARGVALRGVGLEQLWPQVAALTAITALLLTATTLRFHRRMG